MSQPVNYLLESRIATEFRLEDPSMPRHARLRCFAGDIFVVLTIAVMSVIVYLPATKNFFISDDFTLMRFMQALELNPLYIWQAPTSSEFFRITSYIYFWFCFHIFGLNARLFYWSGIGLHMLVALLVYVWLVRVTRDKLAAWVSAMFFSAYAIHQEAVMWISAANELTLALACMVFLLLWERYTDATGKRSRYVLALAAFATALFSKEAAVVLGPLAILRLFARGYSAKDCLKKSVPLLVLVAAYVALWLSQAHRNFFISDHYYDVGPHFFTVYSRSLAHLLAALIPFVAAFALFRSVPREWDWKKPLLFFSIFVPLSVLPFSFLTYSNYIPSRNMYFPSIGISALIGILFVTLYNRSRSIFARRACVFLLIGAIGLNMYYIWRKDTPEYAKRAAPTTQLILALRQMQTKAEVHDVSVLHVCQFPLHPSIGVEVVRFFTNLMPDNVIFTDSCEAAEGVILRWEQKNGRYTTQLLSFNQPQPDVPAGTR
jgi:hypothetical protein